jgi:Helix-turn-helix domain
MILDDRLALSIKETAQVLGNIHPKSVRNLIRRKKLTPSKPDGLKRTLVPVSEIQRLLAEGMTRE